MVFKTIGRRSASTAGSIPVRLRHQTPLAGTPCGRRPPTPPARSEDLAGGHLGGSRRRQRHLDSSLGGTSPTCMLSKLANVVVYCIPASENGSPVACPS